MADMEKRAREPRVSESSSMVDSVATCESGSSKRDRDGTAVVAVQDDTVMEMEEGTDEEVMVTAVVCAGGDITEEVARGASQAAKRSRVLDTSVVPAVEAPGLAQGAEEPAKGVGGTGAVTTCGYSLCTSLQRLHRPRRQPWQRRGQGWQPR